MQLFWRKGYAATSIRDSLGHPLPPSAQDTQRAMVDELRASLGEAAFTAAWDEGHRLSFADAVAEAMALQQR